MEKAIATFNENARLYRRLATIYMDQNKLDEAIVLLKSAMTLEPMMPDTYGLLGEASPSRVRSHGRMQSPPSMKPWAWTQTTQGILSAKPLFRDQALAAEEAAEGLANAETTIKQALEIDKGHMPKSSRPDT